MEQWGDEGAERLDVVDMHAAGEPVRIFDCTDMNLGPGSILALRREFAERHDGLRRALMHEPRGHADMYGALLVRASAEADAAVLFTHSSGYSTMCGHATIALGRFLHDSARKRGLDRREFRLECPCGVVPIQVGPTSDGGAEVAFRSVESFAESLDATYDLPGVGTVRFDIGYGGAFYAILPSSELGLPFGASTPEELARAAGALVWHLRRTRPVRHPFEPDLSFLYGAILTPDPGEDAGPVHPHLCWFGEGQLDRSPTGSGVAARLAVAHARGAAALGQARAFAGLSGDSFVGNICDVGDRGVFVQVSGRAYYTARTEFILETHDPFRSGLQLPRTLQALLKPERDAAPPLANDR